MAQTKIRQKQIVVDSVAVPYASTIWTNSSGNYSTTSTSFAKILSTGKVDVTVKYGKLVRVDLVIGGIWGANAGYAPNFDVGLDGETTRSTSGPLFMGSADFGGNWSADGSLRGIFVGSFFFANISTGSHSFYPLWKTTNSSYAVYIGQYAVIQEFVTELYMQ